MGLGRPLGRELFRLQAEHVEKKNRLRIVRYRLTAGSKRINIFKMGLYRTGRWLGRGTWRRTCRSGDKKKLV